MTTLTPEFSFKYTHNTGDDIKAFRIQIGTSADDNSMWDNTQDYNAENGAIVTVIYAGDPLSCETIYWWRVKAQDNKNCWSDWSEDSLLDSYSESNMSTSYGIDSLHPAEVDWKRSAVGQAFNGMNKKVSGVKFYLKRVGSPGNLTARLYEGTGTLGINMIPTGSALTSSAEYDASTIDNVNYELVEFTFTTSYQMNSGTDYCAVIEASSGTWDGSNKVLVGADTSSPTHEGNYVEYYHLGPDSWYGKSTRDACFYLYGPTIFQINQLPTVSITAPPDNYENIVGAEIQFASSASDPDNDPLTYSWDFGDNETSIGPSPTHTYTAAGDYTVALTVSDNYETALDSITVHIIRPWTGTVMFKLVNLYKVSLEKDLQLLAGSKLVVKFYTYGDAFENENVIETFTPPWYVEENERARHPGGIGVKKVRLDLTTDNTEDVISTIASFTVRKVDLEIRYSEIPLEWALAPTPEEKLQLEIEFSEIPLAWALAPS